MMSTMASSVDSDGDSGIVRRIKEQYKSSVSLKIAAFGVVLMVVANVINYFFGLSPAVEAQTGLFDLWGLWAAILSIWGGTMFILGLLIFSAVWLKRQ
jgi:hypothetical protein